jgi:hypothetical protein
MDPFSCIALVVTLLGLGATGARIDAADELRGQQFKLRDKQREINGEYKKVGAAAAALGQQRIQSFLLLQQSVSSLLERAAKSLTSFTPPVPEKITTLAARCRNLFLQSPNPISGAALNASFAALGVEGIQIIDRLDGVHDCILNQSVGDVAAQAGLVDGADALGVLGDTVVGDVLGAALVIFSVVRIGFNLEKIDELNMAASSVRAHVQQVEDGISKLKTAAEEIEHMEQELADASYAVFKYSLFDNCARNMGNGPVKQLLEVRLRAACGTWWQTLSRPIEIR